jgi:6-phosphofructokinase 1
LKKRIGILTGGGDVPSLNAVIAAAKSTAQNQGLDLIGFVAGWQGVLEGRYIDLNQLTVDPLIGGTILKSSRVNIARVEKGAEKALSNLEKTGVNGLIVIGGDDTLSSSFHLPTFPQMLIAKTIDNDVGRIPVDGKEFNPDKVLNYFTLGYPSAAEKIVSYVDFKEGLRTTAYSHERIVVVESMGMHAGWLALASGLGHPDFIIVPEFPLRYEALLEKIIKKYEKQRHLIIVVAEGAKWEDGTYVHAVRDEDEDINHPRFGGAAEVLKNRLKKDLKGRFDTRNINSVNPSYLYRCGAPNCLDRTMAGKLGREAVLLLDRGLDEPSFLSIQKERKSFRVKHYRLAEFQSIENLHRFVDERFYDPNKFSITESGRSYLENLKEERGGNEIR